MSGWGVHTVFLPRENLFHLEEWIDHNIQQGAQRLYLYDNTGSRWLDCGQNLEVTGRNKYGLDVQRLTAHLSDEDVHRLLLAIVDAYQPHVELVRWAPMVDGIIQYQQCEAVIDCVTRFGHEVHWLAHVDMDEFIVLYVPGNVDGYLKLHPEASLLRLRQRKFNHILLEVERCRREGRPFSVHAIQDEYPIPPELRWRWAPKCIFRPQAMIKDPSMGPHDYRVEGPKEEIEVTECCFHHYNFVQSPMLAWEKHVFGDTPPAPVVNRRLSEVTLRRPRKVLIPGLG
jgi:Glycosyltransferase family 92